MLGYTKSFSFGSASPTPAPWSTGWDESAGVYSQLFPTGFVWSDNEKELASFVALPDGDNMDHDGQADKKIEHAIVSIGPPEGSYNELCGQGNIHRDFRYPIRATLQYYRATSSGTLDEVLAREINDQFKAAEEEYGAVAKGSLVVNPTSQRTTEMQVTPPSPAWWQVFCDTHYPTREAAAAVAFKGGRYLTRGMQECESYVLDALLA